MLTRQLGTQGLTVSAIGLGCMGMSDFYGGNDEQQSLAVLAAALEVGVSFWDTSDIYGPHTNEQLLGRFFKQHPAAREQVQLASKFGIVRNEQGEFVGLNGRPEYVKAACDASLKRLQVDHLDLYYQHRVDPQVPIEETVGAMADLVSAGKVRYVGLSEASENTIRRAHAVHPLTAVQSEYSLWSRDVEESVLPACQHLQIGFVPYSPLGRGFLTGAIRGRGDLQPDDWRLQAPRFSAQNFDLNLALVAQVNQLAESKGCTNAQLALAWLLAQYEQIVPIPGTRRIARLSENAQASAVELTEQELSAIDEVLGAIAVQGARYPEAASLLLCGDTPELA